MACHPRLFLTTAAVCHGKRNLRNENVQSKEYLLSMEILKINTWKTVICHGKECLPISRQMTIIEQIRLIIIETVDIQTNFSKRYL